MAAEEEVDEFGALTVVDGRGGHTSIDPSTMSHENVIDALLEGVAPLMSWLQAAVRFYKDGKTNEFVAILEKAVTECDERNYAKQLNPTGDGDVLAGIHKDQIGIFNALAAYYTTMGAKEHTDKVKRDGAFTKANDYVNKADRFDAYSLITRTGKGLVYLNRGDFARAGVLFTSVVDEDDKNTPALLGRACAQYHAEQYTDALHGYKTALQTNPRGCPPCVRMGLGLCFYRLENVPKARQCFQRVLQLEPTNVDALAALAVLELNAQQIKEGMQLLKTAYSISKRHPQVLNHLANHFFFKRDMPKVQQLARMAYHLTEDKKMRAESCYLMARANHVEELFEGAYQHYVQALNLWPGYVLPLYGLSQMFLYKNQPDKAIGCLEQILLRCPDNPETLKILGSAYARLPDKKNSRENREKAIRHLKKALALKPEDVDCILETAILHQRTNMPLSLAEYNKASLRLKELGEDIPGELWNNIGVLRSQTGDNRGAFEAYQRAYNAFGSPESIYDAVNVTVTFNVARAHESLCEFQRAQELYRGILENHSTYIDCHLRLGLMAMDRGQPMEAAEAFKEVFTVEEKNPDAWAMLGNLQLSKNELDPARKTFEKIVKEYAENDVYALLALGNVSYMFARPDPEHPEKEKKHLDRALHFFKTVLKIDNYNLYAANGVGIVLADKGHLRDASEAFQRVLEATEGMPDVMVNIAHCATAQGEYSAAVRAYTVALKKFFGNKDVAVLLWLARAQMLMERFDDCRQTLMKALHLSPNDPLVRYNLALCLFKRAVALVHIDIRRLSLEKARSAVKDLETAKREFTYLSRGKVSRVLRLSKKYIEKCDTQMPAARQHAAKAEERAAERAARQTEIEARYKAKEEAERAKLEAKREVEVKRKMEEEEAVRKKNEELVRLRDEWQNNARMIAKEVEKKERKKRKKEDDGIIEDEEDLQEQPKKKKRKKASEVDEFVVPDEPEEEGSDNFEGVNHPGDDDDVPAPSKKKLLSRRGKEKDSDEGSAQGSSSSGGKKKKKKKKKKDKKGKKEKKKDKKKKDKKKKDKKNRVDSDDESSEVVEKKKKKKKNRRAIASDDGSEDEAPPAAKMDNEDGEDKAPEEIPEGVVANDDDDDDDDDGDLFGSDSDDAGASADQGDQGGGAEQASAEEAEDVGGTLVMDNWDDSVQESQPEEESAAAPMETTIDATQVLEDASIPEATQVLPEAEEEAPEATQVLAEEDMPDATQVLEGEDEA